MSIQLTWTGDSQFNITTEGGFSFKVDATSNTAPCPTEILLSALGSCSATDVVLLLQKKGFNITHLENEVTYTLTEDEPRLYESANLHFTASGTHLTEDDIISAAQEAVSKHCHVCLMLQPTIAISCSAKVLE